MREPSPLTPCLCLGGGGADTCGENRNDWDVAPVPKACILKSSIAACEAPSPLKPALAASPGHSDPGPTLGDSPRMADAAPWMGERGGAMYAGMCLAMAFRAANCCRCRRFADSTSNASMSLATSPRWARTVWLRAGSGAVLLNPPNSGNEDDEDMPADPWCACVVGGDTTARPTTRSRVRPRYPMVFCSVRADGLFCRGIQAERVVSVGQHKRCEQSHARTRRLGSWLKCCCC